jgi:carbonic anhydrase
LTLGGHSFLSEKYPGNRPHLFVQRRLVDKTPTENLILTGGTKVDCHFIEERTDGPGARFPVARHPHGYHRGNHQLRGTIYLLLDYYAGYAISFLMAIDRLISGFKSFRETYYEDRPDFYRLLVEKGQKPEVMIIACSDSRVNPSIIAKADPGELFIVRNVANLVPPYELGSNYHGTSAAIEFAVRDLNVKHIIILGHSHCGGIRCLCEGHEDGKSREFIDDWMSIANKALDGKLEGEAQHRHVEREAVKVSLDNLLSFPWVKSRVEDGRLKLHGWWFDLEAGELLAHEVKDGWKTATG